MSGCSYSEIWGSKLWISLLCELGFWGWGKDKRIRKEKKRETDFHICALDEESYCYGDKGEGLESTMQEQGKKRNSGHSCIFLVLSLTSTDTYFHINCCWLYPFQEMFLINSDSQESIHRHLHNQIFYSITSQVFPEKENRTNKVWTDT